MLPRATLYIEDILLKDVMARPQVVPIGSAVLTLDKLPAHALVVYHIGTMPRIRRHLH